jgi:hypothetical protein
METANNLAPKESLNVILLTKAKPILKFTLAYPASKLANKTFVD